jgi:hypothetical protein
MEIFIDEKQKDVETFWRAIILFGRNTASYKFALGKTLLDFATKSQTEVSLSDLAVPFANHLLEHLERGIKQTTSASSRFLEQCQKYSNGEIGQEALIDATTRLGFVNVIDAFHVVNHDNVPVHFFEDDRRGGKPPVKSDQTKVE